jgi:hypothetical protein
MPTVFGIQELELKPEVNPQEFEQVAKKEAPSSPQRRPRQRACRDAGRASRACAVPR